MPNPTLENKIFTVSEFNEFIDILVSQEKVVVEGEISEIHVSQEKWLFATIKDANAAVEVFAIAEEISTLPLLEIGMLIHVFGRPRLHQKSGRFRIWAEQIIPAGEGALRIAFEKLKEKLSKEGLFAEARKRPLPLYPKEIGLITAKGSRAYSDFIKVLTERLGGLKIYFYPVQVQGINAIPSIVRAFEYFNQACKKGLKPDLLVLTRGGGSLEDLMAFNSEEVARAIFASETPVVCGVGHEEDISLADMAADFRASTPSNAAESIIRERNELLRQVNFQLQVLEGAITRNLEKKIDSVDTFIGLLNTNITRQIQTFKHLTLRFSKEFGTQLKLIFTFKQDLAVLASNLFRTLDFSFVEENVKMKNQIMLLKTLDYKNILKRGFSLTYGPAGKVLKDSKNIKKADEIKTILHKGEIKSKVI